MWDCLVVCGTGLVYVPRLPQGAGIVAIIVALIGEGEVHRLVRPE